LSKPGELALNAELFGKENILLVLLVKAVGII